MLPYTHTNTHALPSTRLRVAQHSQFKISQSALEVLSSDPSEEDLGHLFETEQFSPELEDYLFDKMDNCSAYKSYLELVQAELLILHSCGELSILDLLVGQS